VLTYFDNPGVSLPTTITTWVAQSQMPEFLNKMHSATLMYAENKKTVIFLNRIIFLCTYI